MAISRISARPWQSILLALSCTALFVAFGCSRDHGRGVPVNGSVTHNGTPLESGFVSFMDDIGTTVALGVIRNGKYEMEQSSSHHGVPPGQYIVTIQSWIERPGSERPDGSTSKGVSRIPMKYCDLKTSGLSASVGPHGEQIDFAIEGNP